MTWSQLYILSKTYVDFSNQLKDIYKKDKTFQKILKENFEQI